ncbi:hypothetical protein [uncultured Nocardioides sp.]|uniref:hypothetical protein n=1 Tax=uncultured Nocardioides sp. TaxID=198441 RepID=UPI00260FB676|nr:hypothetical protein [uncultured Nocardioides sp.]
MSDEDVTRAGWQNPGGQQPPPSYGYGQQPPPSYGYGQQPSPYGYGPGTSAEDDRRPTSVSVAGWLGIAFSALWALFCVVFLSAALAGYEDFVTDVGDSSDATAGVVIVMVLLLMGVGALGVFAGVLVLRRSNPGRILLTVLSSLAAFTWLASIVAILPLVAAIATVVLLFTGGANDWFARRTAAKGGYGPGPGGPHGGPYGGAPYVGGPQGW